MFAVVTTEVIVDFMCPPQQVIKGSRSALS